MERPKLMNKDRYGIKMKEFCREHEAWLEAELEKKDPRFGNARYIRNLFEKTIEHQANRLSSISDILIKYHKKLLISIETIYKGLEDIINQSLE